MLIYVTLNDTGIGKLGHNEMLSASTEVGSGIISADFNAFGSMHVINDTSRQFTIEKGEKLFFVITQDYWVMTTKLKMYEIDQKEFFGD
jgi:dUTPase